MKSALMIFFILTIMVLVNCSPKARSSAIFAGNGSGIVNGVEVPADDPLVKHVVMITDGVETHCTGTLIAKDIVLTAAHCLRKGQKMYVGFSIDGTPKNIARLRPHLVTAYKIPEHFEIGEDNQFKQAADVMDMMIVKFDNGTPEGWEPAELLESETIYPPEIAESKILTAIGYGLTDGINHTGSGLLRKARMRISNPIFSRTEFITDGTFSSTCQGDSGGPGFLRIGDKHVVVGVISRGAEGCSGEMFYTKVNAYTQWIKDTVKEFSAAN